MTQIMKENIEKVLLDRLRQLADDKSFAFKISGAKVR